MSITDTVILTDLPAAGDWLLGDGSWQRAEPAALGPGLAKIWRQLAAGRPALRRAVPALGPWRALLVVDEADGSQFDALQKLGDAVALAGPVACVALTGRGFHGLRDRAWAALRGNLHLSVALPMDHEVSRLGPGLSMLPAVAVQQAVRRASGGAISPGIKWVNDLLVNGKKVSGVLTAARIQGDRVQLAVLGAGVNLAVAPSLPWDPFVPAAGCLAALPGGSAITPAALLTALLDALGSGSAGLLERGPARLLEAYRERAVVVGRRVMIWEEGTGPPAPPVHSGVVRRIRRDLSLELDGVAAPVTRGRLAFAAVVEGSEAY